VNLTRSILHVDDDPQITRLVGEQLRSRGYDVTSLNDPTETMKELMTAQHRIIILDIDMPNLNGLDLLQDIKTYDGGVQVIMLTGIVTLTTVLRSLRLGAEACFFKPMPSIDPLVEALEDIFRKNERWWIALDDLSHRKRGECVMAGA
jgi:DNA-binding NtrC family response regulator